MEFLGSDERRQSSLVFGGLRAVPKRKVHLRQAVMRMPAVSVEFECPGEGTRRFVVAVGAREIDAMQRLPRSVVHALLGEQSKEAQCLFLVARMEKEVRVPAAAESRLAVEL